MRTSDMNNTSGVNTSADTDALSLCARLFDLSRPLAVFDLETTGIDVERDAVIQVGIARLDPGGETTTYSTLVDPGRLVPEEVQDLTGITNDMVSGAPGLEAVAPEVNRLLGTADLCGYNVLKFDLPFLEQAMERVGIPLEKPEDQQVLDVYQIYRTMEPHTLERAVAEYTGRPFHQSHQALDDVEATVQVLAAQLARYELSGPLHEVIATVRYPYLDGDGKLKADGERIVVCFGKHEGRTIQDIAGDDPSYLDWVTSEIGGEIGRIVSTRREALQTQVS